MMTLTAKTLTLQANEPTTTFSDFGLKIDLTTVFEQSSVTLVFGHKADLKRNVTLSRFRRLSNGLFYSGTLLFQRRQMLALIQGMSQAHHIEVCVNPNELPVTSS